MSNADWASTSDGWHFLSSPVELQPISPNFTTDPYDFFCWYEPANLWVNFKNTTVPPTWNTANGSTNFTVGTGYLADYDVEGVKIFSGKLNVTDIPITGLTITPTQTNRSWHLLGNPFCSALTWDASGAWFLSNISGVAKIWNEVNQSYTDLTSTPPTVIPATNGFMVQVSSGTGSLTLPASKRNHSLQPFYKSAMPHLKLTVHNYTNGSAQESTVYFNPSATTGFDLMYDGEYFPGYGPIFYSSCGDIHLSTNSLPDLNSSTTIPFTFIPNEGSSFGIEVSGLETITENAWLLDTKTATDHNLSLHPLYQFTASPNDEPNRFLLHFSPVGITENMLTNPVTIFCQNNTIFVSNKTVSKGLIFIYNMIGQELFKSPLSENPLTKLDFKGSHGYYLVKVVTQNSSYTSKIFID